jgi:TolB-like protein
MSIFTELKRRNVFRVALLYVIVSWIILQVTDVGVSLLDIPAWTGKLVFLLLAVGFPLILIFSWVYEITPDGLKKESAVDRDRSIADKTANKLNTAVIVLLVLALTGMIVDRFLPAEPAVEQAALVGNDDAPGASIAVLKFENISSDEENEYFSAGLSEELLNLLARIPNLRVAARTSAFSFSGSNADIATIGAALNVAHILEGSVRKSGNKVRITAQLIKTEDGFHLWSQTWDRQLDDIFAVQDEISSAVVESLKISLLGEAPAARQVDPEAYTLYLRGKSIIEIHSEENLAHGAALLRQALEIEPEFADAWAVLASSQTNQVSRYLVPRDEGFAHALVSNQRALEIDPGNVRARSGLCWIMMYYERDFPAANNCVQAALVNAPMDASTLNTAATFYRNVGQFGLAIEAYKKALQTDPLAASINFNLVLAYLSAEQLDNAVAQFEIFQSLHSGEPFVEVIAAGIELRRGMPEAALGRSDRITGQMRNWIRAIAFQKLERPADVEIELEILKASSARSAPFVIASIYAYRGEADNAFDWLQQAIEIGDDNLVEVRGNYLWEPVYSDPRWQQFLAEVGISDADIAALED